MRIAARPTALALLAALIVGGIGAPTLHRVSHALDHQRTVEASRAHHAGHTHGEGAAVESTPDAESEEGTCLLCFIRWAHEVERSAVPLAQIVGLHIAEAPEVVQSAGDASQTIRGPPVVA